MRIFSGWSRAPLFIRVAAFVVALVQVAAPLAHVCHGGGTNEHHIAGPATQSDERKPLICVCSHPKPDEDASSLAPRLQPQEVQCLAKILAGTPFVSCFFFSFERVFRTAKAVWAPGATRVFVRAVGFVPARGPPDAI